MQPTLILALAGCSTPTPPATPEPAPTEVELVASMEDHYTLAITTHDAVIRARLDDARSAMKELSQTTLPAGTPAGWTALHQPLRAAATTGAQAADIESAARAVGAVGAACGSCHSGTGEGPTYPAPAEPDGSMNAHQWATERLWEGLTGPWDLAWTTGSATLATTQVFDDERTPALKALADGLRAAGETAKSSTTAPQRAEAYATLLGSCAACHEAAEVVFPAPDVPPK